MRTINVVDISHHQADVDFVEMKAAGVLGVIHKASQGLRYRDPMYSIRRRNATRAGLLWGAYHFMDASDEIGQALNFYACAELDDPGYDLIANPMLLACDYEDNRANSASLFQAYGFCQEVSRWFPGISCKLYAGNRIRETLKPHRGGAQNGAMIGIEDFFRKTDLWLAHYTSGKPNIPWPWNEIDQETGKEPGLFLWQFTEKGKLPGVYDSMRRPAPVDGNYFDGTFDQLRARWGAS